MRTAWNHVMWHMRRVWTEERGQDLIEYALLAAAGFVAVAAVMPDYLMPTISGIFSKIVSQAIATCSIGGGS